MRRRVVRAERASARDRLFRSAERTSPALARPRFPQTKVSFTLGGSLPRPCSPGQPGGTANSAGTLHDAELCLYLLAGAKRALAPFVGTGNRQQGSGCPECARRIDGTIYG